VDFIGTLDGLYMGYVESIGSPWKPVGDCKVQLMSYIAIYGLQMKNDT